MLQVVGVQIVQSATIPSKMARPSVLSFSFKFNAMSCQWRCLRNIVCCSTTAMENCYIACFLTSGYVDGSHALTDYFPVHPCVSWASIRMSCKEESIAHGNFIHGLESNNARLVEELEGYRADLSNSQLLLAEQRIATSDVSVILREALGHLVQTGWSAQLLNDWLQVCSFHYPATGDVVSDDLRHMFISQINNPMEHETAAGISDAFLPPVSSDLVSDEETLLFGPTDF